MTWVDLSSAFAYASKLTATQMQNLRDNVVHTHARGRHYVTLSPSITSQGTTASATYVELVVYRLHVPIQAEDLIVGLDIKTSDAGETVEVKAEVLDDAAGTADDEASHTGDTDWDSNYLTVDCSSLSNGSGTLKIHLKISGGATGSVGGVGAHWNK